MTDHLLQEDIHGMFSIHLWRTFLCKGFLQVISQHLFFSNYLTLDSLKYKSPLIKTNTLLSKYWLPQIYLDSV